MARGYQAEEYDEEGLCKKAGKCYQYQCLIKESQEYQEIL